MTQFQEIENPSVSQVAQVVIYKTLWSQLPCKSFVSGLWLRVYTNTPLWVNCFYNVLPVDKFPYFKYFFGNIILVSPGERGLLLQGSSEDRIQYALDLEEKSRGKSTANWNGVSDLEAELKKQYLQSFPVTHRMIVGYSYSLQEQQAIVGRLNHEFWEDIKGPQR
jgi:hypothetical protein